MTMKRSLLRTLLPLALAAALTACGGGTTHAPTETAPGATQVPAATPAPTEAPALPPEITVEKVDLTTEDMGAIHFTVTRDRVKASGAGYEALAQALARLDKEMEEELTAQAQACLPDLRMQWEARDEAFRQNAGFALDCTAQVCRAEEGLVSIYFSKYVNLGGAHPMVYASSANLDAKTGALLRLEDLPGIGESGAVSDAFLSAVTWELSRIKEERGLYGAESLTDVAYQNTVCDCLLGDESQRPAWLLEKDGIRLIFDPYILAPYASGQIEVKVDYDPVSGRLGEKYFPSFDQLMEELEGEWILTLREMDGEQWNMEGEGTFGSLTFQRNGSALYVYDSEDNELDTTVEMVFWLKEGPLWRGFPAQRCLEYEDFGLDPGSYTLALDDHRLILRYQDEQNDYTRTDAYRPAK